MSARPTTSLLLIPMLLLTACGALDMEEYASRRDASRCEFLDRCEHPLGHAAEEQYQGPCETWEPFYEEYYGTYAEAEARGTLTLLPEAEACLEALEEEASCAAAAACGRRMMEGHVEPGGECRIDEECVEGAHCESSACPGTCVADAPEGAVCTLDSECLSGECWDGVCTAEPGEVGDTCLWPSDCATFRCVGAVVLSGVQGVCSEPLGAGEPCKYPVDCNSYLECIDGVCVDRSETYTLRKGDACGRTGGPYCERGLVCAFSAAETASEGVCALPVGSGEACVPAFPDPCPEGEYCDAEFRRCLDLPTDGEPCGVGGAMVIRYHASMALTCAGNHNCVEDVCRYQGMAGEVCQGPEDCWFGACTDGACDELTCEPEWY